MDPQVEEDESGPTFVPGSASKGTETKDTVAMAVGNDSGMRFAGVTGDFASKTAFPSDRGPAKWIYPIEHDNVTYWEQATSKFGTCTCQPGT